jgi:phenylalanyl-tRNA synthetase alpha chain
MATTLDQLRQQAKALQQQVAAETDTSKDTLHVKYFGKKQGLFTKLSQIMRELAPEDRKEAGQILNATKSVVESRITELTQKASNPLADIDTTLPGIRPKLGQLHPTTQVLRSMNAFFRYLGYSVYQGPEVETDEYNFNKLNLPMDHPARELQDTLYISEPDVLLRTHTSSVETRALSHEELPIRIVVPGKVYRNETSNATNNSTFYQYEGLVVDRNLSMADLKGTLVAFAKFLYGEDVKTRFRCKYYPQVEPGAGMDIRCTFCHGEGCIVCKHRGWIEVLGSGMVHPNMLRKCGIDPEDWTGFAFGMGLDRLVMLKHGINDVRKLYNGELVVEERV